ncbi:2Fe-2S ferredoxin-type domain-containing protein [Rubrivivax sp. A210]|uniref:FAD-dependent oxidoreductase n=1 Tax=Rubrivivax sp. A210 TaxID=2772301 RepID=UPI001919DBF5|nr:FAD-dependent oxidoreductase [Rubrivivax sp. A210]CAD5369880.1 2Fe-2S ferredoxin-type domain-containing protein [Rubrivivax sp. A210]
MATIPIVPVAAAPAAEGQTEAQAATQFFSNYTKLESRVPMAAWYAARMLALGIALALAALLILQPELGLKLFWGLAIPVVPALLVVAPGLWRQVCPMATMNQLPRLAGYGRALELPAWLRQAAFGIAVGLFLVAVALRVPLLNHSGALVGGGVLAVLALALAGGWVFKGRSGWCGTFCPLAPIQRTYGQAPLIVVKNGYCNPCVGCQKSCYDFNPRAAVFSDVYDDDPRHAAQRRLFMGLLPGLILAYFLQGPAPSYGEPLHAAILLVGVCASAGLYGLAVAFAPANPYRVALAFGALALAAFYWFAGPIIVRTLSWLAGAEPPAALLLASQGLGLVLAATLAASGLVAERRWNIAQRKPARAAEAAPRSQFGAGRAGTSLKDRLARADAAEVTDRGSGISFQVGPDATLLEAIEGAGLKINFGCRAGVCGADPVAVCEGHDNLSPPGDDELATLRRLGLEGRARLACMCTVKGPVLIDRDARSAPPPKVVSVAPPRPDRALPLGLKRVVIVGNGVAGMGVAEALRRESASVQIDIVGNEPHAFYNRMGIGRLIYDSAGLDALQLVPPDWPQAQRVKVWSQAVAARIDRTGHALYLASGEVLPYDKLVLATGSRSTPPDEEFLARPNAFVLRSADDAQAIRSWVQRRQARRALVVGGGVLGVEAADALHKLGLKVTLLQRADRLMNAQLDEQGAARLTGYLESIGIQVVTHGSVARYEGSPQLQTAWLAHGPRVRADVFVAALGIQANTFLAEQAGLKLGDNGIRVDAQMRTSDPDIHAVGDVAELKGTPRGLWPIGAAHAATAVSSMLGEPVPYATPRIVLQLKCEGIDLRSQGEIVAREGDEDFHARDGDAAWWRLIVRHGQLAGGLFVGPPGSAKAFTKLLQQPVDIAPIRAELRQGSLEGLKDLLRG